MDNLTDEKRGTADTAQAEEEKEAAAGLGKFKDVKALMNAYASLEAEFTQRSQRLKELEEKSKAEAVHAQQDAEPSSAQDGRSLYERAAGDEEVKNAIIADYLKAVCSGRGAPMATGGVAVPSPKNKPASIKEAGRLARQFLKNDTED